MQKRILSLLLVLMLCVGFAATAFAASEEAVAAADALNELGLFKGVGDNEDGTPNYNLDGQLPREQAVTLLVRLLGKEGDALAGTWTTPFTDVADWAAPYVGYAFENGLTNGVSETLFGSAELVSASQYLTFVLRALGYESGVDFEWDSAWTLTDELEITAGEYNAETNDFLRADAAIVSNAALAVTVKEGEKTLLEVIEENLANAPVPEPEKEPLFGIKIDVPETWASLTGDELAEVKDMIAEMLGELELEGVEFVLQAMCMDVEVGNNIIVASMSIPEEYAEELTSEALFESTEELLAGIGLTVEGEITVGEPVELGGNQYVTVDVKQTVEDVEMTQRLYISIIDGEIVYVAITAMGDTIDEVAAYIS